MEMLKDIDPSDIASWRPDGKALIIYDKQRFTSEVMPVYFKGMMKFTSFTRRMNRWKFTLQPYSSKTRSVYSHPLFMRDDVQRCLQMRPKLQKTKFSTQVDKEKFSHCHIETKECPSTRVVLLQNPSESRADPVTSSFLFKRENYNYEDNLIKPERMFYQAPYFDSQNSLSDLSLSDLSPQAPSAAQEAMHSCLVEKDRSYQHYYQASLLDAYAQHQSQLTREIETSRLAYTMTMLAATNLYRL